MRCGLYGKLPAKRDFIAVAAPREFLAAWEPWLQGGISASRQQLGSGWQEAYLKAPIWRFWLGAGISGGTVLGALMPSVDGVGRYFPLCVFVRADPDEAIAPPEVEGQEDWLSAAEDLLLSALAEDGSLEKLTELLGALPSPSPGTPVEAAIRARDGSLVATGSGGDLAGALSGLRRQDHARLYASTTFWWTVGGEGFAPLAVMAHKLPDPYVFTGMLTGRFADGAT